MRLFFHTCLLLLTLSVLCFGTVDSSLLALVPPGTKMVAEMDLDIARQSAFGEYLIHRANTNGDLQQFVQQTGVDPRQDIHTLVLACSAPGANEPETHNCAVLLSGTFNPEKLKSLVRFKSATSETYGGLELIVGKDHAGRATALAFPDTGLAVMGGLALVHQVIDSRSNPTTLDPQLNTLIASVGPRNDAWFASILPVNPLAAEAVRSKNQGTNSAPQQPFSRQAFDSVSAWSGGVIFRDVVQVSIFAVARSEQDATALADVMRFGIDLVQTQSNGNPSASAIGGALQSAQITTSGNTVQITASIPEKSLEQMAEAGPARRNGHPASSTTR